MTDRFVAKSRSNNSVNNNQNLCALAVAKWAGGSDQKVRYLHTIGDLVRAVRKSFTVRSRLSTLGKNCTVDQLSARINIAEKTGKADNTALGYIVHTQGHVLAMNKHGQIVVDTAYKANNNDKIVSLYVIMP